MQQRSKLIFAVAAMTLSGLAGAQTTARSVVSDARFGPVYAGYDSGSTPASAVRVVKQVASADAWAAPLGGAAAVYALALSPDGLFVYAAGSKVCRQVAKVPDTSCEPENAAAASTRGGWPRYEDDLRERDFTGACVPSLSPRGCSIARRVLRKKPHDKSNAVITNTGPTRKNACTSGKACNIGPHSSKCCIERRVIAENAGTSSRKQEREDR
jgi:hypothetical protein